MTASNFNFGEHSVHTERCPARCAFVAKCKCGWESVDDMARAKVDEYGLSHIASVGISYRAGGAEINMLRQENKALKAERNEAWNENAVLRAALRDRGGLYEAYPESKKEFVDKCNALIEQVKNAKRESGTGIAAMKSATDEHFIDPLDLLCDDA
jgi:hypothetical protein